jgi:hypothetical protein
MRPVPFSAKFQRVHPGTTGVTVLEHLERLDAVEASLERLAAENETEEIEEDVGECSSAPRPISAANRLALSESALVASSSAPSRAGAPELAPVPETDSPTPSTLIEEHEEDVVALSKSLSHLDTGPLSAGLHVRGMSSYSAHVANRTLDWMQEEPAKKRVMISEVRMTKRSFVIKLTSPLHSELRWSPRNPFFGVGDERVRRRFVADIRPSRYYLCMCGFPSGKQLVSVFSARSV